MLVHRLPAVIGIPIGSPMGSLVSEVFTSKLESEFSQPEDPLLHHVVLRRHYVDDVLCAWDGSMALVTGFLNFLNYLYPTTEFTVEIGEEKINFLDLTISIEGNGYS